MTPLSQISFPVGGIGAGSIGISGSGRLIDWEIFNRADKGSVNRYTHFAVRAEKDGEVKDFRILNGDLPPPYQGEGADISKKFSGIGFGPNNGYMCGWPHFRSCSFNGTFPIAKLAFEDEAFPGSPSLKVWSPFVPGEDRIASMPIALFDLTIENTTESTYTYTAIGVLANPWINEGHFNKIEGKTLTCHSGRSEDDITRGEVSLSILKGDGDYSYQTYWYRGGWFDASETYYRDAMRGGDFKDRCYTETPVADDHGLLALRFELKAGEKRTVRFAISWNIPERCNDWNECSVNLAKEQGVENRWRNYYATQWSDTIALVNEFTSIQDEVSEKVTLFRDALYSTTMPKSIIDGASANLSTLVSPTCLRLEDGTFYGWEGVGGKWGSCEGSCTHVWNYAQSLPFLFPALERSMREANFRYCVDPRGGSHFRLRLPLGYREPTESGRPCADGQFGDIMKSYRDWKISGDDAWLNRWWPTMKRMIEFAWSKENPDRWDPEQSGVLTGRQHHTLDMELFGASSWLNSHYLGALKAAVEMALAVGDIEFAGICDDILSRGMAYTDSELWNGDHYIQKLDLTDKSITDSFNASDVYWNDEAKEIKYQIADGVAIDGVLGQLYASLYGIGDILDKEKVKSHLLAIYNKNFIRRIRDSFNPWRTYTLNDEAGVRICTWEKDKSPAIPLPYNSETMNGFEWAYASHLAYIGLTEEATAIADAIRDRYDGVKRNPWNEIECGNNYARSMAAYGVIVAWSGFSYDMPRKEIGFAPRQEGDFTTFWALGDAWGTFTRTGKDCAINVLHGTLDIDTVNLPFVVKNCTINNTPLAKGEGFAWNR